MHEKTVETRKVFNGRIFRVEELTVELENGERAKREIIRHNGAVAVLPKLPVGRFVFVRQFRKPVEDYVLEVAAGRLEQICAGIGVEPTHLHIIEPLPSNHQSNVELLKRELEYMGPSLIISRRPCIQTGKRPG